MKPYIHFSFDSEPQSPVNQEDAGVLISDCSNRKCLHVSLVVLYGESGTGGVYGCAEGSDARSDHTDAGLAGGGH